MVTLNKVPQLRGDRSRERVQQGPARGEKSLGFFPETHGSKNDDDGFREQLRHSSRHNHDTICLWNDILRIHTYHISHNTHWMSEARLADIMTVSILCQKPAFHRHFPVVPSIYTAEIHPTSTLWQV
jgi:hypothetical protein